MGSRSSSRNTSATTSSVNQDIFGISDIGSGAIAAGGNVTRTNQEIMDLSTNLEDNSDRSQRTNIDASSRTSIQANDSSDRSIRNSGNTNIEGDRNRTFNTIDARDMSDRSIDARDLSNRSVNTQTDARDLSDRSVQSFTNIQTSDPETVLGALSAIEDVAGDAIAANSATVLSALAANNNSTGRALDAVERASARSAQTIERGLEAVERTSARSAQTIERGLETVSDSLGDFGALTLALAKEDAAQTENLLEAGQKQVAQVVAANKTETAQGFDRLTETLVTLGGVAAAAFVIGA